MSPFLLACLMLLGRQVGVPHSVWLEAESLGPLKGANFSFMQESRQTRESWAIAGPDAAAAFTQGGESEFLSVAARADEPGEVTIGRETEFPAAGVYTLWVRYADYRNKKEAFGVRVRQAGTEFRHIFGLKPVVDELDPMKLLWDWAYGWDSVQVSVAKGPASVELYTTGPTEARRCVDCLCFTTDGSYRPSGREKPDTPTWSLLRAMQANGMPDVPPLGRRNTWREIPRPWKITDGPPNFLWNVGQPWLDELNKPADERVDAPFSVDPPLTKEFLAAFKGKQPPIYSHPLSGPVIHIPLYPAAFTDGSPFLQWLARHPNQKFAILLNYGEPVWPKNVDRSAVYANLKRFADRFVGFIAGENVAYAPVDTNGMNAKIRGAKSRRDVLKILRDANTAGVVQKFSDYYGEPVTAAAAWAPVISCLSANNEAWAHAICDWGATRIGHENTGNSPALARRLAFLRGACRQFGAKLVDYQSCNLGDSATMFSREQYLYPASSRYILDNSYDAWAGAGVNWLLKDYLLWHIAGVSAFYNEQGIDLYWKPGGGAAGDGFPVQLSPKGRTAEAVLNIAAKHPRGTQFTPIAFLLDEAHGYTQERFEYGAFGLDPQLNPAALMPGRHEASIRGWFDIAYYPTPINQGEPASAIRQTYVNGIFGDIFDAIVTAPNRSAILSAYPVVVAAGEVEVTPEYGRALREYMRRGGTLVVSAGQLSGAGVRELDLPAFRQEKEADSFTWTATGVVTTSNVFRYRSPIAGESRILATTPDGSPLAVLRTEGQGALIVVGVPLGIGIDERPVPLLALLMQHLASGQIPLRVSGDVEWALNRLDDGGWLATLMNNRGVIKPTHGVLPTDFREAQTVTLRVPFAVAQSAEWITDTTVKWQPAGEGAAVTITIPAGATRMIEIRGAAER